MTTRQNFGDHVCMRKIGMGQVKTPNGVIAATFLWVENGCLKVLQLKNKERNGYKAQVIGFGRSTLKRWNKAQHHLFTADYIPEKIYEYRTDEDAEVGSNIIPDEIFPVGSFVDVSGYTIGRGFAGVMKRWNFSGLGASHGVSKAHRKPGSTGQRTQPGRVIKGKKMPGHYGAERQTIQNLSVVVSKQYTYNDRVGSLIALEGGVPGSNNSICFIKKSIKKGGAN